MVNNIIEKTIKKFNDDNGNRKFTTKELVIFFNTEQKERIERLESKFDTHLCWGEKIKINVDKTISEHDKLIQHVTDELVHIAESMPAKGFCGETQNIINCWQPDKKEPPLNMKVQTLWYDRKIIKFLTGALIIAIITSVGSLIVTIVS